VNSFVSNPDFKNKRSEGQKAADLAFIECCIVRGKTQVQIAQMLAKERPYTLSQQQISADVAKLRKMWNAEAVAIRTEAVADELMRLKALENEAWTAWEKSKQDKTTKTAEQAKVKSGKRQRITIESQNADSAPLRVILEIIKQRRQLLGLDAPKEMRHLGDSESPVTVICKHANEVEKIDLGKLTVEQLEQWSSLLEILTRIEPAQNGTGQTTTPTPGKCC